ncbi:MAG: AMP-dependent synthetase/ligase [Solirubrobacteraceae bacterium]
MTDDAGSTQTSGARTVAQLAFVAGEAFGDRVAARFMRDGEWQELSFTEHAGRVHELALGLMELGIKPGERVCILADTRPDWSIASLAVSAAGAVVVPIYPTNSPEECEWVAGNSGAGAVIAENAAQLQKIEQVRANLPELRFTIGIEAGGGETALDELAARGRDSSRHEELRDRQAAVELDDAYIFIYTSGTTGPPKGCVLTHRNAMSVGQMVEHLGFVSEDDLSYLFLPLAHVFALSTMLASLDVGTGVIYFGGDTRKIIPELAEAKPTYLPSVPRIFEKLYSAVTASADPDQLAQAVAVGEKVRELERAGRPVPDQLRQGFELADELLFSKVRAAFGGRLRQAVTGAAPISADILRFFDACGVRVLEGWGMTETTAVGTVNTLEHQKIGTVGQPLPGVEVRIAEDGEILTRGPNVFREYWRNPEATAETLVDGWLHTGDLGHLDEEGYLSITGRKKDIIITAGGKNLAPANLENDLKASRWISQAVMHGDRRPYPVAIVTLDAEEVVPWAREHGLPEDLPTLAGNEKIRELIQAELDSANTKYAQVEQIKKFTILDHDLSQETGELTPTLKVKRNVINERYADVFDAMYGSR